MEMDPDPTVEATPASPQDGTPPGSDPVEVDATTVGTSGDPPSQPGSPRTQPRAPASAHPSGMWFCPIPRCARREGASPTGWGCLQSLISHLRSVYLSTGSAPHESWPQAHNRRVCLACHELSAVGSRCPGPRCYSAMLAALAAGNSAPPRRKHALHCPGCPPGPGYPQPAGHAGPHAAQGTHCGLLQLHPGPDVPAAGRGARADVGGPGPPSPLPPRRAGPSARGGKAIRSSSTQKCHLNCLSSVLDPLEELVARVKQAAPADGPRTWARIRAAAAEAPDASSRLRTGQRPPSGPSWPKGRLVGPSSC